MGLEILDFTFRIEKLLKIKADWKEVWPLSHTRTPPDLSVAEIHRWLVKVWDRSVPCYEKRWMERPTPCGGCDAILKDLPIPGFCGRCGARITAEQYVWEAMVVAIGEAAGVDEENVRPDALIHKDLDMG